MGKFLLNLKNFMELTRFYSLNMALASCMVIFAYAYYSEKFLLINFILLIIGLCSVQLGANLFDCYVDVKAKLKQGFNFDNMNFSNERKARLIRNGTFSLKQVEIILISLFTIAILIGIYFTIFAGPKVIIFAAVGAILTLLYPISSKMYLAEAFVGLTFGPLAIMGGYYALTGDFNSNLHLLSWAIFFTTIVLLHTHNIMDWEFDVQNHKNTLAILTGSKINAIKSLSRMMIAAYAIVIAGVITQDFNPKMLYVLLTMPIAIKLVDSMKDYINIKDVKFEPKWYWGMFENWNEIKALKLDFFMFRFYLARNFSFFFALFAAIGAMI